jgi:hypothetical protein
MEHYSKISTLKLALLQIEDELRIPLDELPNEIIDEDIEGSQIRQGFLIEIKDGGGQALLDIRVRERDGKYTMTCKYRPENQEAETEITQEMFDTLWPLTQSQQHKTRYTYKGWEIDDIQDEGIFAEYEFEDKETKASLPRGWKVKSD